MDKKKAINIYSINRATAELISGIDSANVGIKMLKSIGASINAQIIKNEYKRIKNELE